MIHPNQPYFVQKDKTVYTKGEYMCQNLRGKRSILGGVVSVEVILAPYYHPKLLSHNRTEVAIKFQEWENKLTRNLTDIKLNVLLTQKASTELKSKTTSSNTYFNFLSVGSLFV